MEKAPSGGNGNGDSRRPVRLALLTALSLVGTLVYVFVLLVPAWRIVHVDRALIGAHLANQSSSGDSPDTRPLWDALSRDPQLRTRSANAFRECLTDDDDAFNATESGSSEQPSPGYGNNSTGMQAHLLDILAGVVNASSGSSAGDSPSKPDKAAGGRTGWPAKDRCWFLDLNWSIGAAHWARLSSGHRALLRCTQALFLLAVGVLLCACVCLTCSLYGCFAAKMAGACRAVLFAVHCLTLSQLVALAILQDASARLAAAHLRDLLEAAGFPDRCADAVTAQGGICSLVLLCLLCLAAAGQMLLLLLPPVRLGTKRRQLLVRRTRHQDTGTADTAGGDKEGEGALGEDARDTNPLI